MLSCSTTGSSARVVDDDVRHENQKWRICFAIAISDVPRRTFETLETLETCDQYNTHSFRHSACDYLTSLGAPK